MKIAIRLFLPVLAPMTGCGPDQYQRLDRAHRKCDEHVQQLQQELRVARDKAASLKNDVAEAKQQLLRKDDELAETRRENNNLLSKLRALGASAK